MQGKFVRVLVEVNSSKELNVIEDTSHNNTINPLLICHTLTRQKLIGISINKKEIFVLFFLQTSASDNIALRKIW